MRLSVNRKNVMIATLLILLAALVFVISYKIDSWHNPARKQFRQVFGSFLQDKPKKICDESRGGWTDASPYTFYHAYYNSVDPQIENSLVADAKAYDFDLRVDNRDKIPGYDESSTYLLATSHGKKLDIQIARNQDKVSLLCDSPGYKNYGQIISPPAGQSIVEFQVHTD